MISSDTGATHHLPIQRIALRSGWQLANTAANELNDPQHLATQQLSWRDAMVPGTVAQSLELTIDQPGRFDSEDWWYRTTFSITKDPAHKYRLCFDGLATLAQVWLNGSLILDSRNMFLAQQCHADELIAEDNEIFICFRSLDAELAKKKPRPRWKTALVPQQNLRWLRTTLLGRIPGWTPPIHPVGPWRDVTLEIVQHYDVKHLNLLTSAIKTTGHVDIDMEIEFFHEPISCVVLSLDEKKYPLNFRSEDSRVFITQNITIEQVPLWWPHTHGQPNLLRCHIEIHCNGATTQIDCGRIGFKHIALDRRDDKVQIIINDVPTFCRGACWTVADFRTLTGSEEQLRASLILARDAGANMLRIGGTMTYESDSFYALCDELGILVWQDFMFANMDYPVTDIDFRGLIEAEIRYQLGRLQRHVCIGVYCGSSEIEQQASMLGLPRGEWSNDFFSETLPKLCSEWHAPIPYFPSTPCEGALPIHVDTGLAHYYGVGAYRRSVNDVKYAGVKFTPECLGFSNIPEPQTIDLLMDGTLPPPHHPLWKARQPRDTGPGWDFEDIRDYYLKLLFNIDPVTLRSQDIERYYALSRIVTGEVMKSVFAEWRRADNNCSGGLVWFYKDLWPGAGWGIIDSENRPKAALHYLRRAWAPRTVLMTDEGLNGLHLQLFNELASRCSARIDLELWRDGKTCIAKAEQIVDLLPRSVLTLSSDAMLGNFTDITYSYRFGPPKHDVVVARMTCTQTDRVLGDDFYFPQGLSLPMQTMSELYASASMDSAGNVLVTLQSAYFLQSVHIDAEGFLPSDNSFHCSPNQTKQIRLTPIRSLKKFKAHISALNIRGSITLRAEKPD